MTTQAREEPHLQVAAFPNRVNILQLCAYCPAFIPAGEVFYVVRIWFEEGQPSIYKNLHEGCYQASGLRNQIAEFNRRNLNLRLARIPRVRRG